MKRYDVFYYNDLNDRIQTRDTIIHAENDVEAIQTIMKQREANEMGIKVDTKEKRNHIIISLSF